MKRSDTHTKLSNVVLAIFAASFIFVISIPATFAGTDRIIQAGLDSTIYNPGDNITVSGVVYNSSGGISGTSVNITILNSTWSKSYSNTTDSQGKYSMTLSAPTQEEKYSIEVSSGTVSVSVPLIVSTISDILVTLVNETIIIDLEGYNSTMIAGVDSEINTTAARTGKFSYGSKDYYVIATKDDTGEYATVHMDDDNILWFNNTDTNTGRPMLKFLEEDSMINFGEKQFNIIYIDPQGSEIILAEKIRPIFSGGESINVLALALNKSGSPLSDANLSMAVYYDNTSLKSPSKSIGTTTSNGMISLPYQVGTEGGIFHIAINEIGHVSYNVRTFILRVEMLTPEGVPVYVTEPDAPMNVTISVLNTSTNQPIKEDFTVNVTGSGPDGSFKDQVYLKNGSATEKINAPPLTGTYTVKFEVSYNGAIQDIVIRFDVKQSTGFELYTFPLAKNKGPSQGFAPGEPGAILVGARKSGTGDIMDLYSLTDSGKNVTLVGIFDKNGDNVLTGGYQVINITEFFSNPSYAADAPEFLKEDMKREFGNNSCVILLTVPENNGIYDVKISTTIGNMTEYDSSVVSVQDIFIFADPINGETGNFQWAIGPGGTVTLMINAYDPTTGSPIPAANITSAYLIEVFAQESGVVTDEMVNESFSVKTINGVKYATITFVANDSVMGDHFVRLKVTANITRNGVTETVEAIGDGWFQTKMYSVWVYPSGDSMGTFGSDSTVDMTVEVRDAAGSSGISGAVVSLDSVIYSRTWEKVPGIYSSVGSTDPVRCTTAEATNTSPAGTCTLSFVAPQGWNYTWKGGGYELRVVVNKTDEQGQTITDYGHGWFEVRNFIFQAWPRNWEVATDQEIDFEIETRLPDSNFTPIQADITIEKVLYFGTRDNWAPPTVINDSVGVTNQTDVNGKGIITLPRGLVMKNGQYSVILNANANANASGYGSDTTEVYFYASAFTVFADTGDQNWGRSYSPGDVLNITVKGFSKMDWSTWPPSGDPHNLSDAWVQFVEKEGMWGMEFKSRDELDINSSCDGGNTCNLSLDLSGFPQGNYNLVIIANDSAGDESEAWMWFRVELASVRVPELITWYKVETRNTMSNLTTFKVDGSCGGTSDTPIEPNSSSSNCKYKAIRILTRKSPADFDWTYNYTFFILDKTNRTLYVNTSGPADEGMLWQVEEDSINFSSSTPVFEGGTFVDTAGTNWTVRSIDNESNIVSVEMTEGVVGYDTNSWNDEENKYLITYPLKMDVSLSKSGKPLIGESLHDEDWMNVDLDGDGQMMWDERYPVVMLDTKTPGIYDLVMVSNTTEFNISLHNATYPNSISFGGDPIYLISAKYHAGSSGDTNYYQLTFTSNKAGWPGMDLGVFPVNSIVMVPIMVTTPSNSSNGIAGANVTVVKAVKFGMMGEVSYDVVPFVGTTNSRGFVMVLVNTSGLPKGEYFLKMNVTIPGGQSFTTDNIWDNPRISIRSFMLRGDLGFKGRIKGLREWSENAGNLAVRKSDEIVGGFTEVLDCGGGQPDICRIRMWPYDNVVFYNQSGNRIVIDDDGDGDLNTGTLKLYMPDTMIPVPKPNGNREWTNITVFGKEIGKPYLSSFPYNGTGVQSFVDRFYNFTFYDLNVVNLTVNLTISKNDPWGDWIINDSSTTPLANGTWIQNEWGENTTFRIVGIGDTGINISWEFPTILFNSTLNIEGREKVARTVDMGNGYGLIIYNSPLRNTTDDVDPMNEWKDMADTVRVIDANTGALIFEYGIGEKIPEAGNMSVVKAEKWNERVYLSNLTINGSIVYPLPWVADQNFEFYVANFTEKTAGIKLKEGGEPEEDGNFSTVPYYIILFDNEWNDIKEMSNALIDDDTVFDDRWICPEGMMCMPYDAGKPEQGAGEEWPGSGFNYSERWMKIGEEGWPFSIMKFNKSGLTVDLFSFKDWIKPGQNLTLWITANNFNGSPLSGNVSVDSVEGVQFDCDGDKPISPDIVNQIMASKPANIIGGSAYLKLDLTNAVMGDYSVKFKVTSSDGRVEYIKRHFFVEGTEIWEGCEPTGPPPPPP